MSNGTPNTLEKLATWIVVAGFGDQLVVDPENNLRDLAAIASHPSSNRGQFKLAVIRDDYEDPAKVTATATWNLTGSTPDEVMTAWGDAKEIADTLNRALGQVVTA